MFTLAYNNNEFRQSFIDFLFNSLSNKFEDIKINYTDKYIELFIKSSSEEKNYNLSVVSEQLNNFIYTCGSSNFIKPILNQIDSDSYKELSSIVRDNNYLCIADISNYLFSILYYGIEPNGYVLIRIAL
jgi:hypothetical protein